MTHSISHSISGLDVQPLRELIDGEVFGPRDESWDEARQAWNLAVDQWPAAVVLPASVEDVVATVVFVREHGLRVAPQGTGHGASALGDLSDTILLKTARMRRVEIDAEARTARVEAGAIWIEVVEAAAEHGLAALAGSSADVGVVGYTLGGGLSQVRDSALTRSPRSRTSPPPETSSPPTATTSPTSSGPSAAAASRPTNSLASVSGVADASFGNGGRVGFLQRMTNGAFYGSRAKLAEKVEGPVTKRTPLSPERFRSLFGAVFLFWSTRRVVRALRAGFRR